jgi:hypothetical protein
MTLSTLSYWQSLAHTPPLFVNDCRAFNEFEDVDCDETQGTAAA